MDTRGKLPKPRKKRTVRIKLELHQWIEEQIKKGKFRNFSHVVDVALEKLRDTKEEEKSDKLSEELSTES